VTAYKTRHLGLAAAIRAVLGPERHERTFTEPGRLATFEFLNVDGACSEVAAQFFQDNGGGLAVPDARNLLSEHTRVRKTLAAALRDGEWRNECL
jgi:hypothetical protein